MAVEWLSSWCGSGEDPVRMKILAALVAAAALAGPCGACAQQPAAGTYVTAGGWGKLKVQEDGAFSLEAVGTNGHHCGLEGRIVGGRAVLEELCVVSFTRQDGSVHVGPEGGADATRSACRTYCGMRADFEGVYRPELPACSQEAMRSERAAFLAEYQGRHFRSAAARLEKVLGTCGHFLWWMTEAEVRNDLALAQYRAGRRTACAQTLQPLAHLLKDQPHYPPVEREWADTLVPQLRFNWKMCARELPS